MKTGNRKIIVVGDRVLVRQRTDDAITEFGLILPQTVVEKEKVQAGIIISIGPGVPLPSPELDDEEPWRPEPANKARHIPLQAEIGDFALFLKKHAVEIEFDSEKYLIVPQAAILVLFREDEAPEL
jgi:co-chaperonin GroES (HSP10)